MLTAVEAEAEAVLAGLSDAGLPPATPHSIGPYQACRSTAAPWVTVLAGGVGPAAAAAATATALASGVRADLVLSAGIAGGFAPAGVGVGEVVVATESRFADLGADTPAGFRSAVDLGWVPAGPPARPALLATVAGSLRRSGQLVHTGPVLTVSTVTGTAARAAQLAAAHRPVGEAMEGAAVASTAARFGRPVLELRTVSNLVGDRDPAAWDIPAALATLRVAIRITAPGLLGGSS